VAAVEKATAPLTRRPTARRFEMKGLPSRAREKRPSGDRGGGERGLSVFGRGLGRARPCRARQRRWRVRLSRARAPSQLGEQRSRACARISSRDPSPRCAPRTGGAKSVGATRGRARAQDRAELLTVRPSSPSSVTRSGLRLTEISNGREWRWCHVAGRQGYSSGRLEHDASNDATFGRGQGRAVVEARERASIPVVLQQGRPLGIRGRSLGGRDDTRARENRPIRPDS